MKKANNKKLNTNSKIKSVCEEMKKEENKCHRHREMETSIATKETVTVWTLCEAKQTRNERQNWHVIQQLYHLVCFQSKSSHCIKPLSTTAKMSNQPTCLKASIQCECYSVTKKEILLNLNTWIELENIPLNEISWAQKETNFTCY